MTASTVPREFVDGATAIVRGALDAGCTFFAGYPITPASSIVAAMMRELPKAGGVAIRSSPNARMHGDGAAAACSTNREASPLPQIAVGVGSLVLQVGPWRERVAACRARSC